MNSISMTHSYPKPAVKLYSLKEFQLNASRPTFVIVNHWLFIYIYCTFNIIDQYTHNCIVILESCCTANGLIWTVSKHRQTREEAERKQDIDEFLSPCELVRPTRLKPEIGRNEKGGIKFRDK